MGHFDHFLSYVTREPCLCPIAVITDILVVLHVNEPHGSFSFYCALVSSPCNFEQKKLCLQAQLY